MTGNAAGGDKPDPGFIAIEPTAVNLTAAGSSRERKEAGAPSSGRSPRLWFGLGALLLVAVLVFLLLPRWAPAPVVAPERTPGGKETAPTPAPKGETQPSASADTPWEKAQRVESRRESQALLEQLLEAQKTLDEKGVTVWAGKQYEQAMQHARAGDAGYSRQNFSRAHEEYAKALDVLNGLLQGVEELFAQAMKTGNDALSEGDAAAAEEAFRIALAIDPLDRAALLGMERVATLDEVMALIDGGDRLLRDGKAGEAVKMYRRALELDGHSTGAQQQLRLAEQKISEREFKTAMSAGFRLLEDRRHEQARDAFSRALKLKPGSRDARSGLEQAKHLVKSVRVNALLEQARAAEAKEDWGRAVSDYDAALALDSSLTNALDGKKRAALRDEIHERLQRILSEPAGLFDRAVFEETVRFRDNIQALADPGPVLSEQLAGLNRLIETADTPLQVEFRSDSQTRVILYKVGELGYFTSKNLALRPGRYVAVGQRDGYRDVRVEFFVDPDKSTGPVVVRTDEKIALGS